MKFQLQERTATKFQIIDSATGDVVGSVYVANAQEASELKRQWGGATQQRASTSKRSPAQMMMEAFRARKFSPAQRAQVILRGM